MEIKQENIIAAYETATESGKSLLQALFPDLSLGQTSAETDNRPVTERIKTWEDACRDQDIVSYEFEDWLDDQGFAPDEQAFHKLRVIVAALNEGWKPKFTEDEGRWYPWFVLWTELELQDKLEAWKEEHVMINIADYVGDFCGFACTRSHSSPSGTDMHFGSRLCLRSEELADYCGKQFIDLWADFYLIRKS